MMKCLLTLFYLVDTVFESVEESLYRRVSHRLAGRVLFQVALGHIGDVLSPIDQHVIPGPVFWRPTLRYFLVPLVAAGELGIHIDDDTAIVELVVSDALADKELWCRDHKYFHAD